MAFELPWVFTLLNQNPADQTTLTNQCKSWGLFLKNSLITASYTIVQSCDSTQVLTDGTDTWASISNIINGTSAHSWVVLKSPEGAVAGLDGTYTGDQSRLWITIDFSNANAYQYTIKVHREPPTVGTTIASGTSTNVNTYSNCQFNFTGTLNSVKFHFEYDDKGHFIAWHSHLTNGYCTYAFKILKLKNGEKFQITKPYPFDVIVYNSMAWTTSYSAFMFWSSTVSSTGYGKGGNTLGWSFVGTAVQLSPSTVVDVSYGTTNAYPPGTSTNWKSTGSNLSGFIPRSEVSVFCNIVDVTAFLGYVVDLRVIGLGVNNSNFYDAENGYQWISNIMIPTDKFINC